MAVLRHEQKDARYRAELRQPALAAAESRVVYQRARVSRSRRHRRYAEPRVRRVDRAPRIRRLLERDDPERCRLREDRYPGAPDGGLLLGWSGCGVLLLTAAFRA